MAELSLFLAPIFLAIGITFILTGIILVIFLTTFSGIWWIFIAIGFFIVILTFIVTAFAPAVLGRNKCA